MNTLYVLDWIEENAPELLDGPAGCGKTEDVDAISQLIAVNRMDDLLFVEDRNGDFKVIHTAPTMSQLFHKIENWSKDWESDFYLGHMILNYGTNKFLHKVTCDKEDPNTLLQNHIKNKLVEENHYCITSNDMDGYYIVLNPLKYPGYCTGYAYRSLKRSLGLEEYD